MGIFKRTAATEAKKKEGRINIHPGKVADQRRALITMLNRIAERLSIPTRIAMAFVKHKQPHVFPITGGRKFEHLVATPKL
jgi:aryl-alcohol dehydrogenase-like predicted oxidoreductase